MTLFVGTDEGVYRCSSAESLDGASQVLEKGAVYELIAVDGTVYAASSGGLFATTDEGRTWSDLAVPGEEVWSVHKTDDNRLFAGCYPAHLYQSDHGGPWQEIDGLQSVPERSRWYCPADPDNARVRTIRTIPGHRDRLLVGIEVGGLYLSEDGGANWTRKSPPVEEDIHHVTIRGPDEYLVSCGRRDLERSHSAAGLFATGDGAASWNRLQLGDCSYVRESLCYGGTLFVAGARVTPGHWNETGGAQAKMFESTDGGTTFRSRSYPGAPEELVLAWTVHDGLVVGGTGTRVHDDGRLIWRSDGEWRDAGRVPGSIHSLATI